jgi:hypothetical protein
MRRTIGSMLGMVALITSLLAGATPTVVQAAAEAPQVNAVVQWNLHATDALIGVASQPPQQAFPHLAMVHGAVYDAVNAIAGDREGYLIEERGAPDASKEAAAATAAYRVLASIVPAQQPALEALHTASLAAVPDGAPKVQGIAVGEVAAAAMIDARTGDGRFGAFRFTTGTAAGAWRPVLPGFVNDPSAWLKDVRPFLLTSSTQFRSAGPRPLTSSRYARELAEVQAIGSAASTTRTADQTDAARYWAANPHATWARIVRTIAVQQEVGLVDSARLFAEVYLTVADTVITVWADKQHTSFWRPITAIQEAGTDGNPATIADPTWLPLIATPPYPEHPSGLTSVSSAIVETLQAFFHRDRIGWTDTHPGVGVERSFIRLSEANQEVIDARIWSGVHFRTADEQGARIGRQVAAWRSGHYFGRVSGR